jgi:prepilin-type N-terminal cleavage/methylation domain-containing protein
MNKSKGFTIIELIVVIAIIAVLAAIVLVNVTQYINKSKNAAVVANMATLLTNAAVYFDNTPAAFGSGFTGDAVTGCGTGSPIQLAVGKANGAAAPAIVCVGDPASQAWCGSAVTLAAGGAGASTFCVDSTGYKGIKVAAKCTGTTYTCQ